MVFHRVYPFLLIKSPCSSAFDLGPNHVFPSAKLFQGDLGVAHRLKLHRGIAAQDTKQNILTPRVLRHVVLPWAVMSRINIYPYMCVCNYAFVAVIVDLILYMMCFLGFYIDTYLYLYAYSLAYVCTSMHVHINILGI